MNGASLYINHLADGVDFELQSIVASATRNLEVEGMPLLRPRQTQQSGH